MTDTPYGPLPTYVKHPDIDVPLKIQLDDTYCVIEEIFYVSENNTESTENYKIGIWLKDKKLMADRAFFPYTEVELTPLYKHEYEAHF